MCVVKLFIQNFDYGCVLEKGYTNLQLSANPNQKLQYRKFGITGLKSSFRATEKYVYFLGYLNFSSRYGFPKLNATYHFHLKSG